ncbi:hypothetical protein SH601_12060 [Gracilibacillus sp. S3-1-1]|uniref:Uncharacterized protein n=1 Tax=Gracilibacillus pellucidus TaxID=3095368 RepID=A0ACC6M7D3_9BACI|nr:hypothetical protein [Gracilibacillus sp. S3-1-1]MDX8046717.1 hypothetical protein [Gracilibacillus sp. S3-1-1]
MFIGYLAGIAIAITYFFFTWEIVVFGLLTFAVLAIVTLLYTAWITSRELERLFKRTLSS